MNVRPHALLIALTPLVAVALAACGGNDDCCDDIESYFERVDDIDNESRRRFEQLNNDITAAFPGGDEASLNDQTRGTITAAFARGEQILSDVVNDLEDITPPEEVAEAHFEAVEGYNEFRQSYAILRSRLPNILTIEDLIAALEGQGDAGQRANAACDALQKIADDNSIEVTLDCGVETQPTQQPD
jgi:hypothetical protein